MPDGRCEGFGVITFIRKFLQQHAGGSPVRRQKSLRVAFLAVYGLVMITGLGAAAWLFKTPKSHKMPLPGEITRIPLPFQGGVWGLWRGELPSVTLRPNVMSGDTATIVADSVRTQEVDWEARFFDYEASTRYPDEGWIEFMVPNNLRLAGRILSGTARLTVVTPVAAGGSVVTRGVAPATRITTTQYRLERSPIVHEFRIPVATLTDRTRWEVQRQWREVLFVFAGAGVVLAFGLILFMLRDL
jgi:hypothetical protein